MAALHDWHITGLDVRNTFLYGELDEEIYIEQPEGFHVPGRLDAVVRATLHPDTPAALEL